MTHLLTSTATLAAFLGLLRTDRRALQAMLGIGCVVWLVTLVRPALWTQELYGATECTMALFAVLAGLGAARRAHTRPDLLFRALLSMGIAVAFALLWDVMAPLSRQWQYRGVAFADLAACAVLAVVGQQRIHDYLDSVTLRWLALSFGLTSVQLLAFEVHDFIARFAGWCQIMAWVVGMLLLARAGLSHGGPSAVPPRAPASR